MSPSNTPMPSNIEALTDNRADAEVRKAPRS